MIKKLNLFMFLFCLIFVLGGCSKSNTLSKEETYSLSEIADSAKDAGYTVEKSTEIDGGYEVGDECISIQMPFEDGSVVFCYISYYKNDEQLKKVTTEIKDNDFHTYVKKGNIIAVYGKSYKNLGAVFDNILSCNPDDFGSVLIEE